MKLQTPREWAEQIAVLAQTQAANPDAELAIGIEDIVRSIQNSERVRGWVYGTAFATDVARQALPKDWAWRAVSAIGDSVKAKLKDIEDDPSYFEKS